MTDTSSTQAIVSAFDNRDNPPQSDGHSSTAPHHHTRTRELPMTTDFRSICAELVHIANALDGKNALISNQGQAMDGYSALAAFRDVADRARAALAAEADGPAVPEGREPASVVGEPSYELVAQWIAEVWHEGTPVQVSASDLHLASKAAEWGARAALAAEADGPAVPEGRDSVYVMKMPTQRQLMLLADEMNLPSVGDAAAYARAVLARYGHQPAPPAEGEVAKLVTLLAVGADCSGGAKLSPDQCHRAADLLEQRQAAPVPVAEFDCPACEDVPKQGNQPCAVCGRSAPPAAGEVAELALKELERTVVLLMPVTGHKKIKRFDTIRAALKRLQELENKADLSPTPMPLPAVEVK